MRSSVLYAVTAVAYAKECDKVIEMVMIQDCSYSYWELVSDMREASKSLWQQLREEFGGLKLGITAFIDKPSPFRGLGGGRGYLDEMDFCYRRFTSLTTDDEAISDAYDDALNAFGSGGDFPENPYEGFAMAALDPELGFSSPDLIYNDKNELILRIALLVTDDAPHYYGEHASGIEQWNPTGNPNDVRFWHEKFITRQGIYVNEDTQIAYPRLLELNKLESRTEEEQIEYDYLLKWLGPAEWPESIENEGSIENNAVCEYYEYLKLDTVGEILSEKRILPIVVVSPAPYVSRAGSNLCKERGYGDIAVGDSGNAYADCLVQVYSKDFVDMQIKDAVVAKFDGDTDSLIIKVLETVRLMADGVECPEDPEDPLEPVDPEDPADPQDPEGTEDEEKKSNIGVILGSASGGIAGLAALGVLAYKQLGFGMLGSSSPAGLANVDQVDMPDSPVERETMEEVTLDMFQ